MNETKDSADNIRYFAHYDSATGQPVTEPLGSLEDVLDWEPGYDRGSVATAPLRDSCRRPTGNKTLICHDMRGGYLEDRFLQGVDVDDCYRFYYWSRVDVFVYFSHHFVSIPTVAWTNAAHVNGVPVLGTVITEWNDGKALCNEFLETEQKRREFVTKLVDIAAFYRFEGWLINIENEIPMEHMPALVAFVKELTDSMHAKVPGSLVIWYDSVINTGVLEWQNELNDLNREFFDVSDGIFLNYTWKDENLAQSVEAAGTRHQHVYVGVDVFGRGCKGGGGFNTIEALRDVGSHGLSAAIFAPGWVYEKLGKTDFVENERHFWDLLKPCCEEHVIASLPLYTTFCQGWGMRWYLDGEVLGRKPWTNMAIQTVQPCGPENGVSYDSTVSFCGGGCLKVQPTTGDHDQEYKLFGADIFLEANTRYYLSLTHKVGTESSGICLRLRCSPLDDTEIDHDYLLVTGSSKVRQGSDTMVCTSIKDDQRQELQVMYPPQNSVSTDWVTVWFQVTPTTATKLKAVSIILASDVTCAVHVGSFRLFGASDLARTPVYQVENLRVTDVVSRKVIEAGAQKTESELTLMWDCSSAIEHFVVYHQAAAEDNWAYVGVTPLRAYRISRLETRGVVSKFKVQAVYHGGAHTSADAAPVLTVLLEAKSNT